MKLDLNNDKIIISSNDVETYNLKFLKPLFNKKVYKNKNILSYEESFNLDVNLYNNDYIKSNLYTNTLNNNVTQELETQELETLINVEKIQSLEEIDNITNEVQELKELEELQELEEIKETISELEFKVIEQYNIDIVVKYNYNSVFYYINVDKFELFDKLHLFNMLCSNILHHYVDIYEYKGKCKYINLNYSYNEVVKYLDKHNYKFNEFKLLVFMQENNKEFQRIFEFMKYSILQLHKLEYNYKELNKLFLTLSKYIYKNETYSLFLFLHEFKKFKNIAYKNKDYNLKLKRLVLKDKRFNLDISNYDKELKYLNLCFFEKSYKERYSIGDIKEYEEDLKERRQEESYTKGYKRNCHSFHNILGDVRSTELSYNDEFWKEPEIKNENRRTHWESF